MTSNTSQQHEHDVPFPTIPGRSVDRMRLITREQPDEAQSSTSENSFEILSKSMIETSDDEGHTLSVSSNDVPATDDLSSLCDDEEFDDYDIDDDDGHDQEDEADFLGESQQRVRPPPTESVVQSASSLRTTTPYDSIIASTADTQQGESSGLKLEEGPSSAEADVTHLYGIIREFKDASAIPDVLKSYGYPELRLTIKMAASPRFLPISGSYRVLYVGEFDRWAVTDVNNHIGAALNATPSSSRFNIVQGSDFLGTPSSSRVQLERSGSELVVDHCTAPKVLVEANGARCVLVTLDDGSELTFGPDGSLRPSAAVVLDLIIFGHPTLHSETASLEVEEKFRFVRDMLKQHEIPSLDIAVVRPYSREAFAFDANSLRLCVEGRLDRNAEFETRRTLPIDLFAFLAIEPSQLNRHLAYLTERSIKARSKRTGKMTSSWGLRRILPRLNKTATLDDTGDTYLRLRSWASFLALVTMVMVYLYQSALVPVPGGNIQGDVQTTTVTSSSILQSASSASRAFSDAVSAATLNSTVTTPSAVSKHAPVSTSLDSSRGLSVLPSKDHSWGSWLERPSKEDSVGNFSLHITDNHQFTVYYPPQLLKRKSKVEYRTRVCQGTGEEIDIWVKPLKLDLLEVGSTVHLSGSPIGAVNVTIEAWEPKKLLLRQTHTVEIGPSRSSPSPLLDRIERLSKGIKHDLALAQTFSKHLTTQVAKGVQIGLTRVESDALALLGHTRTWPRRFHRTTQTVSEHLREARKRAMSQLTVGNRLPRDVSKTLSTNYHSCASRVSEVNDDMKLQIWQKTRPWRTSTTMRLARERALRLRCNVEKALGKEDTRSCRLLRHQQELKGAE